MYTCGPTVYRYAHVGNLRSYLLADLIRRVLEYHGTSVLHVKNITDVGHMREERLESGGDRVVTQAASEGRSPQELAAYYEAAFRADEALVDILPAHHFPRATEHVEGMIELAERLEDAGFAYRTPSGSVYFSVARFPGYGRLSGNTLDALRAGHRGEPEAEKRDVADFALWKAAEPGRQALTWPTRRWGRGFPGWHLECSVMSAAFLGDVFDVHTGGVDNIFPHHEDEIAQSAALTGKVPARLWVHGEHLLMSGRKMAKSAGNFERITDLVADGFDPLAFRYLALTTRYRHKLEYSRASLASAQTALESLRRRLRDALPPAAPSAEPAPSSAAVIDLHDRFMRAVDDDLDLPVALAIVHEAAATQVAPDERHWFARDADRILGLGLLGAADPDDDETPEAVHVLLRERAAARGARDFLGADALRVRLRDLGAEPIDRADGSSTWRPIKRG
jgi:cysteinyl-tRNA synthetase